jgi:hypothetical protein
VSLSAADHSISGAQAACAPGAAVAHSGSAEAALDRGWDRMTVERRPPMVGSWPPGRRRFSGQASVARHSTITLSVSMTRHT